MKILKIACIIFVICGSCHFAYANTSFKEKDNTRKNKDNMRTAAQLEKRIEEKLPEALVGVVLQQAKTGKILLQYHKDKAFAPASTLKILTAAVALKTLGPDYQFKTDIKIDKDSLKKMPDKTNKENINEITQNLYVQFSGDPSLSVEAFKNLLKTTLQTHNVKKISGNIIIDNTRYFSPDYAYGWSWNSLPWYFSPPITAIMLNENKIKLQIVSNKSLGGKADIIFAEDENLRIPMETEVVSVTKEAAEKECSISVTMDQENRATLKGCWPKKEEPETIKLAIQNPTKIAKQSIEEVLNELTIEGPKTIFIGKTPEGTENLNQLNSEPLQTLVKSLLQDSNNLYAETLVKTLGATKTGHGSFLAGLQTMQTVLTEDFGLKRETFRIEDGSGASRYTVITPSQMAQVLSGIYQSKILRPIFWEALPVWGKVGTLKRRGNDNQLEDRVHAKTGSMIGVTTLAGYLNRKNGEDLIFVIMINNTLASAETVYQFQEALLAEWLD